jgi:hypothetical protein
MSTKKKKNRFVSRIYNGAFEKYEFSKEAKTVYQSSIGILLVGILANIYINNK